MVLVEHDPVMMLSTCISTSSRMLSVLAYSSMSSTDMTALLPVFVQPWEHTETSSIRAAIQVQMRGLINDAGMRGCNFTAVMQLTLEFSSDPWQLLQIWRTDSKLARTCGHLGPLLPVTPD